VERRQVGILLVLKPPKDKLPSAHDGAGLDLSSIAWAKEDRALTKNQNGKIIIFHPSIDVGLKISPSLHDPPIRVYSVFHPRL
jgi:hypothetical protein